MNHLLLLESLAILVGGNDEPNDYKKGFDLVEDLKQKMNENRKKMSNLYNVQKIILHHLQHKLMRKQNFQLIVLKL